MTEEVIPLALKARWEAFGEAARKCWARAKEVPEPAKDFIEFLECMRVEAKRTGLWEMLGSPEVDPELIKRCAEIGRPLAPHPICVITKIAEDKTQKQAVDECLAEGKVHGISLLACKAELGEL